MSAESADGGTPGRGSRGLAAGLALFGAATGALVLEGWLRPGTVPGARSWADP